MYFVCTNFIGGVNSEYCHFEIQQEYITKLYKTHVETVTRDVRDIFREKNEQQKIPLA